MIDVTIAAVANQELSVQLGGSMWTISLREGSGCMSASVSRDNVALVSNVRVTGGTPLLPHRYQESGNFIVTVEGEALPYWDQFGVTQFLVYVTAEELAVYRAT